MTWLYFRGGGPAPSWSPFSTARTAAVSTSDTEENVLRAIRLAGFERAVVGNDSGSAVLRLEIPAVSSAADVEVAWQAGVASLVVGYPKADTYIVQLFEGEQSLLEVSWPGDMARAEVEAGNSGALRSDATFVYLSEAGGDE